MALVLAVTSVPLVSLAVPSVALAECCAPPPPAVESTCPPSAVLRAPFTDLDETPDPLAVSCLASYGVVRGTDAQTFDAGMAVTRAQMARFLFRLGEAAGFRWRTDVVEPDFADVRPGAAPELREALAGLVQGEILHGFDDGNFRGGLPVTRGQAASMLQRFQVHYGSYVRGFVALYPPPGEAFSDDDGSVHETAIEALASTGIVTGVAPDRYAPAAPVTRASMAQLLVRALAYEQGETDGRTPGDGRVRPWFRAGGNTLTTGEPSGPFAPQTVAAEGYLVPGVTASEAVWSFSGLEPGRDFVLMLAAGGTGVRSGGELAFATSRSKPEVAALGDVAAAVTAVNGEGVAAPAREVRVRAGDDGVLRVAATSPRSEIVVPVLHRGGPTEALDVEPPVDDPRAQSYAVRAVEPVAVSGPAVFVVPDAAGTGTILTTALDGVLPTSDALTAAVSDDRATGLRTFSYDIRDVFFAEDGTGIGLDTFESVLAYRRSTGGDCRGDPQRLAMDYVADDSAPSSFRLLPPREGCPPETVVPAER